MHLTNAASMEEAVVMVAAVRRAQELADERDERLATKIRDQIVDAWNKGRK